MLVAITLCDVLCPFVIASVRRTEVILEDGTVVASWSSEAQARKRA